MKICISSTGPGLIDLLDPRFSRCRYYIIYDDIRGEHEAEENTAGMH
jgi:predicted Fe-Mo cluster-binding NifX family protein